MGAGQRRWQGKFEALPSKALAEHFCNMKYTQLNSDVYGDAQHDNAHNSENHTHYQ
jgi:hypothetical protein